MAGQGEGPGAGGLTQKPVPLPQIWCAETGALLKTCRGHEQEVTDFAVSADNAVVASGSIDKTVRVWSLQVGGGGAVVCVGVLCVVRVPISTVWMRAGVCGVLGF